LPNFLEKSGNAIDRSVGVLSNFRDRTCVLAEASRLAGPTLPGQFSAPISVSLVGSYQELRNPLGFSMGKAVCDENARELKNDIVSCPLWFTTSEGQGFPCFVMASGNAV
jgi:hypothetical protein